MASVELQAFEEEACVRLQRLQCRVVEAPLALPSANSLHKSLHQLLTKAARAELLDTGLYQIARLLRPVSNEKDASGVQSFAISSGPVDFKGTLATKDNTLTRSDGAFLSFSITLRQAKSGGLTVHAYRFSLTRSTGACPTFIRFDFDPPGRAHESDGLRAHIHPGDDEIRLPSAVLDPLEALTFVLLHVR